MRMRSRNVIGSFLTAMRCCCIRSKCEVLVYAVAPPNEHVYRMFQASSQASPSFKAKLQSEASKRSFKAKLQSEASKRSEPPRDLRRLQLLREWSHEQDKHVFPRGARA